MTADPLSDVLRAVLLTGAVYFDIAAKAPWVVEQPPREEILPKILPGAQRLIAYHVVTEGRCFASLMGAESQVLEAGEIIVFTNGDAHVMSSSPGMRVQANGPDVLGAAGASRLPFFVDIGEGGDVSARLVCGFLACDSHPFNPLLDGLPRIITAGGTKRPKYGWLDQFVRVAMMESADKRAGGEGVLAKLSELMFIEVVRQHLEGLPPEQTGWLAGIRDPVVGKVLALMHTGTTRNWTIEELAVEVGVSRSVLAERFNALVGMPPMRYLAKWRMQIASGMLSSGSANIATIAAEIGYKSEAAFSRAFKKMVGMPPSHWPSSPSVRNGSDATPSDL